MPVTIADIQKIKYYAAKEMEGKLFAYIYIINLGNVIIATKDWYTVLKGKVYVVSGGKKELSGDDFFVIRYRSTRVGIYNPSKIYKRTTREFTYSQFKKLLHL